MWEVHLEHAGLRKYRHIRGADRYVVEQKAASQRAQWAAMWQRQLEQEARQRERQAKAAAKEHGNQSAELMTAEAQEALRHLENLLHASLAVHDAIDWDSLLDKNSFGEHEPRLVLPDEPKLRLILPREPQQSDPEFRVPTLLKVFVQTSKERAFQAAHSRWQEECTSLRHTVEKEHARALEEWKIACKHAEHVHLEARKRWTQAKLDFLEKQKAHNQAVEERKKAYYQNEPGAIVEYCDMVLSNSSYPDAFPCEFELEYRAEGKILLVDYQMPAPDAIPTLESVTYVASRGELKEKHMAEVGRRRLYDSILYQICLRTHHELYEADQAHALASVVFNGWVRSVDLASGRASNSCILSLQTSREEFEELHLSSVDPKTCFKALKGVASSRLHSITPVAPIIRLDRDDARFVEGYGVLHEIDEGNNLAAMDWEDFEHLIREVFEKEFGSGGGEVRITRASRDAGVDAVAFDPDPIRGGKIVIQAKRYTNTVGVSAVRDLYGTLLNEGAMKGILVTTSDYGPDAYQFAKDKPISLLNGANLLHLLERHGKKARIDLQEAKGQLVLRE